MNAKNLQNSAQELAQMIIAVVVLIPYGHVASYGQVAKLAGLPRHARLVGRVLAQLETDQDVPWHRVINSQGKMSLNKLDEHGMNIQEAMLLAEGVAVIQAKVDLKKFGWQP